MDMPPITSEHRAYYRIGILLGSIIGGAIFLFLGLTVPNIEFIVFGIITPVIGTAAIVFSKKIHNDEHYFSKNDTNK